MRNKVNEETVQAPYRNKFLALVTLTLCTTTRWAVGFTLAERRAARMAADGLTSLCMMPRARGGTKPRAAGGQRGTIYGCFGALVVRQTGDPVGRLGMWGRK